MCGLSESDILQTFAEVGVAIAGFTGVVFFLGNRVDGEWSRAERLQFRILVDSSVGVVLFALLPVVLESRLSASAAWRSSAGLLGVWGVASTIVWSRRFWPHLQAFPTTWRRLVMGNSLVGALLVVACFLVAAGRLSEFRVFIYLIALLQMVAQALANFVFLLRSGLTSR